MKVSTLGASLAGGVFVVGGLILFNHVQAVGSRAGWRENVPGEIAGTVLFFGVLPLLGLTFLAYLLGRSLENKT